jgi:Fe-S cluster biogenesis protein NfuA
MTTDLRVIGDRIEGLLDHLRAGEPRAYDSAEELVRLLTELYGAGLERIVELVPENVGRFIEDDLVANLLILHGLHPLDVKARVEAALESVRPLLGSHGGDVELLDLDEERGAVYLRLLGSCDGCPSSSSTLQHAVEKAILEAAPEIVVIDVEARADDDVATVGVPILLGQKPQYEACPTDLAVR